MSVELTVLIPVWNNEKEIQNAYRRVREVILTLKRSVEILFIDDGSEDATFTILQDIRRSDPQVSILKLSRNYGQHLAIAAGILHGRGNILVTMDVDLQCDPAHIPRFHPAESCPIDNPVMWPIFYMKGGIAAMYDQIRKFRNRKI